MPASYIIFQLQVFHSTYCVCTILHCSPVPQYTVYTSASSRFKIFFQKATVWCSTHNKQAHNYEALLCGACNYIIENAIHKHYYSSYHHILSCCIVPSVLCGTYWMPLQLLSQLPLLYTYKGINTISRLGCCNGVGAYTESGDLWSPFKLH